MQFLVQLPKVLQLLPGFRPVLDVKSPHVRTVLAQFRAGFCEPWRGASERLYRSNDRQLTAAGIGVSSRRAANSSPFCR